MTDIAWESPPRPKAGRQALWPERLAPFRERPGEWGQLPGRWNTAIAYHIRHGRVKGAEPGKFETTTRNCKDGKCDLYIRYIGDTA